LLNIEAKPAFELNFCRPVASSGRQTAMLGYLSCNQIHSDRFIWKVNRMGLHHPKQIQGDEYDHDYKQNMDPTAGFGEPWADTPPKSTEEPKHC